MASASAVTAVIVPTTVSTNASLPAEARKRRRTIMRQNKDGSVESKWQKSLCSPPDAIPSSSPNSLGGVSLLNAALVIPGPSEFSHAKEKAPQKRYEPSIPMSKEEAAEWRREQRRKRNRESAAASRQKTRDRISQLEDVVSNMQRRFEAVAKRLRQYEPDFELTCVTPSPPSSPGGRMLPSSMEHRKISEDLTPQEEYKDHRHSNIIEDKFRPAVSPYPDIDSSGDSIISRPMTEEGVEGLIALATSCTRM
mmetsp:Transcript_26953/g.53835  ORF Transcript_26953/g.53835 Transcript_26953/m.53835 type:complete len:252 (-) Transcript_26953:406-1161(-)